MPNAIEQLIPRPLAAAITTYAPPPASGVYGISNSREWIFIGESESIRALMTHLQEMDTPRMRRQPTGFVFEIRQPARRPARRDRLIFEYEPACNRRSS